MTTTTTNQADAGTEAEPTVVVRRNLDAEETAALTAGAVVPAA